MFRFGTARKYVMTGLYSSEVLRDTILTEFFVWENRNVLKTGTMFIESSNILWTMFLVPLDSAF